MILFITAETSSEDACGVSTVHSTLDEVPVLGPRVGAAAPSKCGPRVGVQLCLGTCPHSLRTCVDLLA